MHEHHSTLITTRHYRAPEVILGKCHRDPLPAYAHLPYRRPWLGIPMRRILHRLHPRRFRHRHAALPDARRPRAACHDGTHDGWLTHPTRARRCEGEARILQGGRHARLADADDVATEPEERRGHTPNTGARCGWRAVFNAD